MRGDLWRSSVANSGAVSHGMRSFVQDASHGEKRSDIWPSNLSFVWIFKHIPCKILMNIIGLAIALIKF